MRIVLRALLRIGLDRKKARFLINTRWPHKEWAPKKVILHINWRDNKKISSNNIQLTEYEVGRFGGL